MLPAGPTVDVLLTEVRRRCGADPSGGADFEPDPEHVAEFFARTRVDFTFDQALLLLVTPGLRFGAPSSAYGGDL
jgi:hypothetical protein